MRLVQHINALRALLDESRAGNHRVALVPTMGNLHAGHIHLVEQARRCADIVVCTIFINPLQFGKNEDLDTYPRTLTEDTEKLQSAGCNILFAPAVAEVYPLGLNLQTVVSVPGISDRHCGASRPGHFDGVATVVSKLFNMVQPDTALFGLKDYQQFMVITKMVADLCVPIQLIGVETQRAMSGLALSSRNGFLSADEQHRATALRRALLKASDDLISGVALAQTEAHAKTALVEAGFVVDYFNISHAKTLDPATPLDKNLVILAAAWMGKTRLIDNILITLP